MPVYRYTARSQSGQVSSGTLEAESDVVAAAQLRDQGLWVTHLQPAGGRTAPAWLPVDDSISKRLVNPVPVHDLAIFYRQLHTLLNSGIGIFQAFEMLGRPDQTSNPALRNAVEQIGANVLRGGRMSEAMARYPWLFDRMQVRMIEAGETGGLLVPILKRLAEYLDREHELRQDIKRKTLYPKLVLLALILIPSLPTLVLKGPSAYFWEIWHIIQWIVLLGVPFFFAGRLLIKTESGRRFYDQVKLAVPVIGPLVKKLAVARFARTMAALQGAGVPIMSSLAMAGETCGNSVLAEGVHRGVPALERGTALSTVLGATHFFPPMFLGMVSTGETSGNLDGMLDKAAEFYEGEAALATHKLVLILSVGLLLVAGLLVALRVIAFYTGMFGSLMEAGGVVSE